MKKTLMWTAIVIVLVGVTLFALPIHNSTSSPEKIVLTWTGLESYPTWPDSQFKVETKGGEFTREFHITFTGTPEQIKSWVDSQSVLKRAKVLVEKEKVYSYELEPQQGASFAGVQVNYIDHTVSIVAYWS